MEGGHIAVTEGKTINIGEVCMFSSNIQIRSGDSHPIVDLTSQLKLNKAESVSIGNQVWLGNDSKILKGVTEDDVMIATGAIVSTNCTQQNAIYAGIPAR
jgi:acetyltransferase-like isoleucine patch superfamily enzyme